MNETSDDLYDLRRNHSFVTVEVADSADSLSVFQVNSWRSNPEFSILNENQHLFRTWPFEDAYVG